MSSSVSIRAKIVICIVIGSILNFSLFVNSVNATTSGLPVFGESGPTVLRLQEALISRGFSLKGGPDGVFSSTTRSTLKTFQRVVGFKATGALDERTAKFLGLVAPAQIDPNTLPAIGSTGDAVFSLQQALINNGVPVKGGLDGIFGIATTIAITKFQSARSLPVTKVLDRATASALGLTPGPAPVVKPVAKVSAITATVTITLPVIAPAAVIAPVVTSLPAMLTIDTLPTRGQRSDAVRLLQEKLLLNGIEVKGGADGIFGVATSISIAAFQTTRGLNVTFAADMPTAIALGILPDLTTLGIPHINVFPAQGRCSFIDTWGWPRSGGRLHEGVDIMGAKGLAIYAVTDGIITKTYGADSSLSGNAIRLTTADNTYFFYAHLDSIAPSIAVGTAVKAGQIIGYMGSTGNVGSSHLHFEIHPGGGPAVSPYPVVKAVDACNVTDVLPQP